jgi:mono/diheme cytochrome c family protein
MMAGVTMGSRQMGMIGPADSGAAECPAVDPKLVAAGRAIFMGAGNCQMCHGANAKGTPLAPDLTDATWLNIDGSYAAIAGLVRTGVPRPKKYPAPMPPMGGGSLAAAQVCAVAAYVYSLGHALP